MLIIMQNVCKQLLLHTKTNLWKKISTQFNTADIHMLVLWTAMYSVYVREKYNPLILEKKYTDNHSFTIFSFVIHEVYMSGKIHIVTLFPFPGTLSLVFLCALCIRFNVQIIIIQGVCLLTSWLYTIIIYFLVIINYYMKMYSSKKVKNALKIFK